MLLLYLLHLNKWGDFWNFEVSSLRERRRITLMTRVLVGSRWKEVCAHGFAPFFVHMAY